MGIIYCLTSPSKKQYIGQTKRSLYKRVQEHCKRSECVILYNAIVKYSIDNFDIRILIECSDDQLDIMEVLFIRLFNTVYPYGYNVRTGGKKGKHCDSSREKMRSSKLGEKNHNFGKPRTEITKKKISDKKRLENHHFYGKKLTYEHKLNLSISHKKDNLPMYMVKVKARPQCYQSGGYAILNHPLLKNKYFTSKNFTIEEKYKMAFDYLNTEKAQRSDGDG